jgi:CRISPR-associated endoribonuclease Cas6
LRLKLVLSSDNKIELPIHYNLTIQGMLYKYLPPSLSEFLHDIGFFYKGRNFKLYTFSRIFSPHYTILKNKKRYIFDPPLIIYISSAIHNITKRMGETFLKKNKIVLGKNQLYLNSIELIPSPVIKHATIKIKTLSPITAYRTFERENGKNFYRYYHPNEEEFNDLLKENIRKKYEIITEKELPDFEFRIQPINTPRKALIKYKDFIIEGYDGQFVIHTDPEILSVVFDAGLGAKNSQGFGMIELIQN